MDNQDAGDHLTLADHIYALTAAETDNEVNTTPEDELATQSVFSQSLEHLPDGLYRKVMACGDSLVVLAPQLISNITRNLAECYMGLRTICDGDKQYNHFRAQMLHGRFASSAWSTMECTALEGGNRRASK